MQNNIIVDEAVIKQGIGFAASALKLKPDDVPDILKFAKDSTPARRQIAGCAMIKTEIIIDGGVYAG